MPGVADERVQPAPRVRLACAEGIAWVTLDRAEKRNALDGPTLDELKAAIMGVVEEARCGVLVLTGAGTTFCAGADLSGLKSIADPDERKRAFAPTAAYIAERIREIVHLLLTADLVSIAAINGPAVGGGWIMALGCDFRLATPDARFWFPEIELGRAIGEPSIDTLVELAGPTAAREIALTARRYSAEDALRLGLLTRIVVREDLESATKEWAAKLAATDRTALVRVQRRMNRRLAEIWRAGVEPAKSV